MNLWREFMEQLAGLTVTDVIACLLVFACVPAEDSNALLILITNIHTFGLLKARAGLLNNH
jgi:hypothetical protein